MSDILDLAWSLYANDGTTVLAYQVKEVETPVLNADIEVCITQCEEMIMKVAASDKLTFDETLNYLGSYVFVYRVLLQQPRKPKSKIILLDGHS